MEAHKELGEDVEITGWRTVDGKVRMIEEESCVKLRRTRKVQKVIVSWGGRMKSSTLIGTSMLAT